MPTVPGADSLPPNLQIILTAVAFLVGVTVYVTGLFRKPSVEVTKDVVVPNVSVMDAEVFRAHAQALRDNMRLEAERQADARQLVRGQEMQVDLLREISVCCRKQTEYLESIDKRLREEHNRLREAEG